MVEASDNKVNVFASPSETEVSLSEHVQSLTCLLALGRMIEGEDSVEAVCRQVPEILRRGLQRDGPIGVCVSLGGCASVSAGFRPTANILKRKILSQRQTIGEIQVHAIEDPPLPPGREYLVDAVVERLGRFFERKKLQTALERSEERFKRLFQEARDGMVLVGADSGQIISANPSFLEMVGRTLDYVRQHKIWDLLSAPQGATFLEEFEHLAADPIGRWVSIPIRPEGKEPVELEISCSSTEFDHQPVFQLACRDVTDRQVLMRRLRGSEMRYRAIFDSTPVAMAFCDPAGIVLDVNACLISMFFADRVPKDRLLGRDVLEIGLFEAEKFRREFQWFRDGLSIQMREVPIPESDYRPGGFADVRCIPLTDDRGLAEGGVVFIEEKTEVLEAQRGVIQSAKMAAVGQMTSGFAHEIGTPLGIISANAQYLLQSKLGTAGREELRVILSETKRITNLIRQLLVFSRPAQFDLVRIDLNDLILEVLRLIEGQDIATNVTLVTQLSVKTPPLRLEPTLITQVFLNLIINACQAMPDGGRLTITTKLERAQPIEGHRAPQVVAVFEDEGSGISPANLRKIFTPFFTTKEVGKGTGLGLSLSYRIMQNHGGTIVAESDGEGKGARFSVYFPVSGMPDSVVKPDGELAQTVKAAGGHDDE